MFESDVARAHNIANISNAQSVTTKKDNFRQKKIAFCAKKPQAMGFPEFLGLHKNV